MRQQPQLASAGSNKENKISASFYLQNQTISGGNNMMANHKSTLATTTTAQQDKKLQELREFALEYVKQIVVKAGEISQERQETKSKAPQSTRFAQVSSTTRAHLNQQQPNKVLVEVGNDWQKGPSKVSGVFLSQYEATDAISERLSREANEINVQFKLASQYSSKNIEREQKKGAKGKGRQIHYEYNDDYEDREQIGRDWQHSSSSRGHRFVQNDETERRPQDNYKSIEESRKNQANIGGRGNNKRAGKGEKRGFYHRLNWHLLIACFSTCLPQSMTDTIPSSMNSGAGSSGRSAPV